MNKINATTLGAVQETLMIPLYGRALESRKNGGILQDPKAENMVQRLDYDFSRFLDPGSIESMQRTTRRTAIIDRILRQWLLEHPKSTVVELGCGLNTRFERTDNGEVNWFDLDMPDVHELWKHFFEETPRRHFLEFSAFDPEWMKLVSGKSPAPCIFIAEASVIYFPQEMIKNLFQSLYAHFPGAYYLFDSATPEFVKSLEKSDALKYCNSRFQWTVAGPSQIKDWIPKVEFLKKTCLETPDEGFLDLYPILPKLEKSKETQQHEKEAGYFLNLIKFMNS